MATIEVARRSIWKAWVLLSAGTYGMAQRLHSKKHFFNAAPHAIRKWPILFFFLQATPEVIIKSLSTATFSPAFPSIYDLHELSVSADVH